MQKLVRDSNLAYYMEGCVLAAAIICCWILSAHFVSSIWSLIALLNYLWLVALMFRIEPPGSVLALPAIVTCSATIVALIFIEHGSKIPELATVGTPGSHSSSYVFYMATLILSYVIIFKIINKPIDFNFYRSNISSVLDRYAFWIATSIIAIVMLMILWLIYVGGSRGFPLLMDGDRFVFRRYTDKITLYSLNLKYTVMFSLGMIAFCLPVRPAQRITSRILAGFLVPIYFLFGDKFFTQIIALAGFGAPFLYAQHRHVRRRLSTFLAAGLLVLGLAFGMTWFIYSAGGAMTPAATMDRLSGRIVGQGELWYLQSRIGAPAVAWDDRFVARNIQALGVKQIDLFAVQQSLGPNYFSNRYAPDKIRNSIARNAGSVTYTAALEPLGLMAFGWIGLSILMIAAGALMALASAYLAHAIRSRSMISAICAAFVSTLVQSSLTQGTPWGIFGIFAFKWLAIMIGFEMMLLALGLLGQRHYPRRRTTFNALRSRAAIKGDGT